MFNRPEQPEQVNEQAGQSGVQHPANSDEIDIIGLTNTLKGNQMNDSLTWNYGLQLGPPMLDVLDYFAFLSTRMKQHDHVFQDLHFNQNQFDDFCHRLTDDLQLVDPRFVIFNEQSNTAIIDSDVVRAHFTVADTETGRIYTGTVLWDCDTPEKVLLQDQAFAELASSHNYDGAYPIEISFLTKHPERGMDTFISNSFSKWSSDFDSVLSELYPRINIRQMISSFLDSNESLLILTGNAGTGKTSLIKLILREFAVQKNDAIATSYVKDEELLKNDDVWTYWSKQEPDVLILDDLDHILHSRSNEGGNQFVNRLLSFSDGVFETSTKVIITTNEEINDVDEALIRPGRCFDMLKMPKLSRDEAVSIWTEVYGLSMNQFYESFGDNKPELRQSTLVSEAERIRDTNPKSYLTDQNVSIRHHYLD